jgi:hypothetical protein
MELFANLPRDIKNIILSYDGNIKYRRGEYVNQIHKDDNRYHYLSYIPKRQIQEYVPSYVSLKITNFKFLFYTVIITEDTVVFSLQTLFHMGQLTGVSFLKSELTIKY